MLLIPYFKMIIMNLSNLKVLIYLEEKLVEIKLI